MATDLQTMTRFHPDAITVPGNPDRLQSAADRLQDLVAEVTDVGKRLRQADAPKETRGPTVRAMSRVAGMLGRVLEADAEQLSDLSELLKRQADLLTDAHTTLEETRRRWRQARQELRTEIDTINQAAERAERERAERRAERERERERRRAERDRDGKGDRGGRDEDTGFAEDEHDHRRDVEPPTEARQVIKAMDQQVLDQFEGPLRRLAGLEFTDRHGSLMMQTNGKVEQAADRYKQSVRAIIEDLVEAMRQVNRVDNQLVEKLPRQEKAILSGVTSSNGDSSPDPLKVSLPDDISTIGEELQECARTLNELGERVPEIRLSIREGRMTPEEEVQGSMSGFQRTWKQHFEEIREDLNHARKAASDIATQLRELDERGAREIRRTFRAD